MDDVEFIEASVRLQIGSVLDRKLVQSVYAREQGLAGSSGISVLWKTREGQPDPANGWYLKSEAFPGDAEGLAHEKRGISIVKPQGALRQILTAGMRSDMIIDMQDRRLRNLALADGSILPNFAFNREIGSDQRILWPLPNYHDLGTPGFLGPSEWKKVPWFEKQDRVAWRGILSGRADPYGDVRREGLRLRPLMRKFGQGDITQRKLGRTLDNFPRYRFVRRYIDDAHFDIGFTGGSHKVAIENYPFTRDLIRPPLSQQDMLQFKYLVVLRGVDVGSSFYWTMNSGSLGLVMDSYFETFASGHFRPWEHYVPFKADLSDFEERLSWCRAHDAECSEMAQRAQEMCRWLVRGDLRDEIAREVVSRVDRRVAECAAL